MYNKKQKENVRVIFNPSYLKRIILLSYIKVDSNIRVKPNLNYMDIFNFNNLTNNFKIRIYNLVNT